MPAVKNAAGGFCRQKFTWPGKKKLRKETAPFAPRPRRLRGIVTYL